MSLLDDIHNAQVRAGEGAVIARLQKLGLVDKPKAEKDPRDTEIERLREALDKIRERSYDLRVTELHRLALAALRGEEG